MMMMMMMITKLVQVEAWRMKSWLLALMEILDIYRLMGSCFVFCFAKQILVVNDIY
jgi:hypothetical protein